MTKREFDLRPFHEAVSHRTRRVRYTWQVFGLTGTHRQLTLLDTPTGRRFPDRSVQC
jgi:hypothetical protein